MTRSFGSNSKGSNSRGFNSIQDYTDSDPAYKQLAADPIVDPKHLDNTAKAYSCPKCKRKVMVLIGVSSVWCNRCERVMRPARA